MNLIRWHAVGVWPVFLGSRFVTAGSRQYCELVVTSSRPQAVEAAAEGKEYVLR